MHTPQTIADNRYLDSIAEIVRRQQSAGRRGHAQRRKETDGHLAERDLHRLITNRHLAVGRRAVGPDGFKGGRGGKQGDVLQRQRRACDVKRPARCIDSRQPRHVLDVRNRRAENHAHERIHARRGPDADRQRDDGCRGADRPGPERAYPTM